MTSRKPVLAYLSLGCDLGTAASATFSKNFSDLRGVDLAILDANTAMDIIGMDKPWSLGTLVLLKNGQIAESSGASLTEVWHVVGRNQMRRWAQGALKNQSISFQMAPVEPDRLDPLQDSSAIDLERSMIALYRFEGSLKDSTGKQDDFAIKDTFQLKDGLVQGASSNWTGSNQAEASIKYSGKAYETGFSVHTNVMPIDDGQIRRQIFTIGYRCLSFEIAEGMLYFTANAFHRIDDDNFDEIDEVYPLSEVNLESGKWHSIAVTVHPQKKRIYLVIDGHRLKDIALTPEFLKIMPMQTYGPEPGASFVNEGWGGVLNGSIDDLIFYDRPLTGKELVELSKRYAKGNQQIATVTVENKEANLRLLRAASGGDLTEARAAIESGANVNAPYENWTSLMLASYYGNEPMVQFLMQHDADPLREADGWTAQALAKQQNHPEIVKLLEDYSNRARFYFSRTLKHVSHRSMASPPDPGKGKR